MQLNQIFCDHMVLQANQPVCIFGEGEGNASVEIDGMTGSAVSDSGKWLIRLPEHSYGGPFTMKVVLNGNEQTLNDIYFGDVILVAGQSNVQMKLKLTNTSKEKYVDNPLLRLFSLKRLEDGEYFFPEDGWVAAEKQSVGNWSALGYLMGNIISEKSGHAVGIIACYQGASMIQSWLPEGILNGTECDIAAEQRSGHMRRQQYMAWNHDGQLYKEMFLKLVPFSLKTVVWYQGEANSHPPENTTEIYRGMLSRLIGRWRKDLMNPELPFIVIQLANYIHSDAEGWKAVQQAQVKIADIMQNVHSVICADICEDNDIHPPTKLPLAQRIVKVIETI